MDLKKYNKQLQALINPECCKLIKVAKLAKRQKHEDTSLK